VIQGHSTSQRQIFQNDAFIQLQIIYLLTILVCFVTTLLYSCYPGLLIPVHVQRWTVLRLYKQRDWHINS